MNNKIIRRRAWHAIWEHPLLYLTGLLPLLLINWIREWIPFPTPWRELASAAVWVLGYPMTAVGPALLFRAVYRGEQPSARILVAPYLGGRLGQILAVQAVLYLPTLLMALLTSRLTLLLQTTPGPSPVLLLLCGTALMAMLVCGTAYLYLTLRLFSLPYQLGAPPSEQTMKSLSDIFQNSFAAGKGLVLRQILLLLPFMLVLLVVSFFFLALNRTDSFAFQLVVFLAMPYRYLCCGGLAEEVLLPNGNKRSSKLHT